MVLGFFRESVVFLLAVLELSGKKLLMVKGKYVNDIKGNFQVSYAQNNGLSVLARYEISIDLKDGIVKSLLPHTLLAGVSAQILDNIIEGAKEEFGL